MSNPVIKEYFDSIVEVFGSQIIDMALKFVSEKGELTAEMSDYIGKCLAPIMVYSIIKIIAEEPDDLIVTQRLVTTVMIYKNGILSLLK